MKASRWGARPTFAGVPGAALDDLGSAQVVVLGAPFDWGTTYRPGARFGPKAIREADYLDPDGSRPHLDTGLDPLAELDVVDVGDLDLIPGYVEDSLTIITDAVEQIASAGSIPIVLGGDHTVTYAAATGVARHQGFGTFGVIHFDAHADTADTHFGTLYGHGTPMRRLIESGAVPGHRFLQVGLRGYWPPPDVVEWMGEQKMRWHLMSEIVDRGLEAVLDDVLANAGREGAGIYLSVDIDVVDPGTAPGTGTPEPGGLTAWQLLDAVRRICRDLPLVGADLVEVSPPYDGPGAQTAFLANRVVLEMLNGMAQGRAAGS